MPLYLFWKNSLTAVKLDDNFEADQQINKKFWPLYNFSCPKEKINNNVCQPQLQTFGSVGLQHLRLEFPAAALGRGSQCSSDLQGLRRRCLAASLPVLRKTPTTPRQSEKQKVNAAQRGSKRGRWVNSMWYSEIQPFQSWTAFSFVIVLSAFVVFVAFVTSQFFSKTCYAIYGLLRDYLVQEWKGKISKQQ